MKPIIFIGSGAVAAEIISYLKEIELKTGKKEYFVSGFLDDSQDNYITKAAKYNFESPYIGKIIDHSFSKDSYYVFGLGSPVVKEKILKNIDFDNLNFPNIFHPSVIVSETAVFGKGNIIYPNCVIGPGVTIGSFNLITSYSFISHDCVVGDNNFFSTSGLSGNVSVKDSNFFGIRVTVIPNISIGSNNTLQAGMIIEKNVTDNETIFYRFKEKVTVIKQ